MKNRTRSMGLLLLVIYSAVPLVTYAQENFLGILEYLDDPFEARIITSGGEEIEPYIGFELKGGMIIQTYETTAEIRLEANDSILRVAEHSLFRFEGDRQLMDTERISGFSLAAGTVRCVAARVAGQGYAIHTPSAAMGVRGTDFIVEVFQDRESLSVLDGVVESLHRASGLSQLVETGYSMDLADEDAKPKFLDEDVRDLLVRMNSFYSLDPALVPQQEGYGSVFDLPEEAEIIPGDVIEAVREQHSGPGEDVEKEEDDTGRTRDRDKSTSVSRREKSGMDRDFSFLLSAGLHPELVQIAESTWADILSMGFGGALSLTAGLSGTPGFFGGLTGGVCSLGGKSGSNLERALWVPVGFLAGIRSGFIPPLSFYAAGEGGMQYARMTYNIEGQPAIEGWVPYLLCRLGLRYDLHPLVLEAGMAFGSVFDADPIPYLRVILGVVYEVEL